MSAGEFDAYLKALGSLLRMKPGQRAELADEFRDHLETRLEELTAAGVPRAEAVETALEEFGDAAGLASQVSTAFTSLSRRRRRKFLMRITASAAATLACGLAVVYLFAPPNRALRPPGPALAQEDAAPATPPPDAGTSSAPQGDPAAALDAKLSAPPPAEFDFADANLASLLLRLGEFGDVAILPDRNPLPGGWETLRGFEADPRIMDGATLPPNLGPRFSLTRQLEVAFEQLAPGTGLRAENRDGILYVTADGPVAAPPREDQTPQSERLASALDHPSRIDSARPGDSLADILDTLAAQHQISILPDRRSLVDLNVDLAEVIVENPPPPLEGYSLRTLIDLILASVDPDLAAVSRDGILFITDADDVTPDLETRIYNVRDLLTDVRAAGGAVGGAGGFGGEFGGGAGGGGGLGAFSLPPVSNQFGGGGGGGFGGGGGGFGGGTPGAAGELVEMILSVTGGESFGGPWIMTEGNGGSIEHFDGLLAVRQTAAVHRQIEDLLAALRRSAGERGWEGADPEAAAAAAPRADTIQVEVSADGAVTIDGSPVKMPKNSVEWQAFVRQLSREVGPNPKASVVVRADRATPAKVVQEVLKLMGDAGLTRLSFRAVEVEAED